MPSQPPTYKKTVLRERDYRGMEELIWEANEYASLFFLRSRQSDAKARNEITARMESIRTKNGIVQDALRRQPINDAVVSLASRASRDRYGDLVQREVLPVRRQHGDNSFGGEIGRGLSYVRDTIPEVWPVSQNHSLENREVDCVPA